MIGSVFSAVIDGPNFVNRLHDFGFDKEYIVEKLPLSELLNILQQEIRKHIGTGRTTGIDFYYSKVPFGEKDWKFTHEEMNRFLNRQKEETGVRLHEVRLSRKNKKEKGVDASVVTRLFEMKEVCETLVLVSSDTDYIPALETLGKIGRWVVTVGFEETHDIELKNASFLFIDLTPFYEGQI